MFPFTLRCLVRMDMVNDSDADLDFQFDFEEETFKAYHTIFKLAVFAILCKDVYVD